MKHLVLYIYCKIIDPTDITICIDIISSKKLKNVEHFKYL